MPKLTIEQALRQGIAAHKDGKLQEAERLYRAILEVQPAHPDANHNLGVLAVAVNKTEAALPLFKTALEANPKVEQFWLSYIDALIKEKQFETAKQFLEQAKNSELPGDKINALRVQLSKISEREISTNANPSEEQLKTLLKHYQAGQYGDAEKLASSITQEFPENQFCWKVLGVVCGQLGKKSQALNANQKAVELAPEDEEVHNNLGAALKELARLEEAEASYRQAIELKSDYADAHYNLGVTLQEMGKLHEAEVSYNQAIMLGFNYAEVHYSLGVTLQKLEKLEEAEVSYRQAIALKSDFAKPYDQLGFILQQSGRFEEAEVCYRKCIGLKPDNFPVIRSRGSILFNQGEFERALSAFDSYGTKESRARALESLYALGKTAEIYERIEAQANIDGENLRVAAFSAFIAEREKKVTAHNFCNNPLDFLYFSNIASHIENPKNFIKELIEELLNVRSSWEPATRTTRNGFQSDIDVFKTPAEQMSILKTIIIDELDSYYSKFRKESCSYIKKWPSEKNVSGWHVILKQQGHQSAHIHPSAWLSGVIYLKVVPSQGEDEGAIEFSLNGVNYSDASSSKIVYQPKLGDIVLFPSSLYHRTLPFSADMDRISVAFDLSP